MSGPHFTAARAAETLAARARGRAPLDQDLADALRALGLAVSSAAVRFLDAGMVESAFTAKARPLFGDELRALEGARARVLAELDRSRA